MNPKLLWRKLLYLLTGLLPVKVITQDGRPYLERYYLGTIFGVAFYIHRFVADDPDRGLHDHPWAWAYSLVLAGWYLELGRSVKVRAVRWFNRLTGESFHRVMLPYVAGTNTQQTCWTLFCHPVAKLEKGWGFFAPTGNETGVTDVYVRHESDEDEAWWKAANNRGNEARAISFVAELAAF